MGQLKNAFLMLILSQGTPLIFQGDEFGNSQGGNNNAWCQDNETGWVNWKKLRQNKELFEFVKEAVSIRKTYPILHLERNAQTLPFPFVPATCMIFRFLSGLPSKSRHFLVCSNLFFVVNFGISSMYATASS